MPRDLHAGRIADLRPPAESRTGSEGGRFSFGVSGTVFRGVVRETGGGIYRVALNDGRIVEAGLRGRLKRGDRTGEKIVIGDRVVLQAADERTFTIEDVEERETAITRLATGGRRPKILAANVDRMVIVIAAADPPPGLSQIDRLLVIAESNGVAPVLVLNKVDLPGADRTVRDLRGLYEGIGYPVLAASARAAIGLDGFRDVVCRGTSVLLGASGVGKSSLLNAIDPDLDLRVGDLSKRLRRGRHTTVSARLIELSCGGLVADTPGFGDVGVWGVRAADLDRCFPELDALRGGCRFDDCVHLREPDCAIRASLEGGRIAASRYESYRALMEEARIAGETGRGG